tara:strand:+ start:3333 stop:5282 length:1950 start_codon:yes stop_codon:yes gene_type:complete
MNVSTKLLQAAAGNAGEAVYVDDVFSTTLYTGTDSSVVVPTGLDLADKGGLIWGKSRSGAQNHRWYDSARGTQYSLISNSTAIQSDQGTQTFGSSSVTLGAASGIVGSSSYGGPDYVLWSFAKQEKFFDIVTYTGDGNADRQINHNLGSVPGMMIIKKYAGSTTRWAVYHRGLGTGKFLSLDDTASVVTQSDFWETAPTATQFTVETNGNVNNNGDSYVAYLFAHNDGDGDYGEGGDEDIIKCGSYTGNGSSGQFINLGFEPQFLLIKSASTNHDWYLADAMRGMANTDASTAHKYLYAQTMIGEESYASRWRIEANGFHLTTAATGINGSSNTYIYMAIARSNKPASEFAATDLHTTASARSTSAGAPPWWYSGFPVDMAFWKNWGGVGSHQLLDRLRGPEALFPNDTNAEEDRAAGRFDYQDGWYNNDGTLADYHSSMFRRAKGFFDVVSYTGDGYSTSFSHNLGVTPELKIIKIRSDSFGWLVGGSAVTGGTRDYQLYLNTNAAQANTNYWSAVDSATQFSVKHSNYLSNVNGETYIAYLFATVAGISKVGSYTGTGSDLNIDCGFSAGARFILIKRTDSTGDWYLYNSNAGIVAGNDPYVLFNTTDAQVTNTDYIDPLSSGFTVTSSAPAGLNASSGNYIFLAIA